MPRYQQVPWNYDCRYKHCCPHLQGLSTNFVFEEYQCSYDENLEHWKVRDILQEQLDQALALVCKLEKENEQLTAKLKALHQRQFKANKKRKAKSDQNKTKQQNSKKKKKRGPPKGHPGWFRKKPDHIDKTVQVDAPQHCPHCACTDLTPLDEIKDHLQEDIVLVPQTLVINFSHHQAYCPKCRRAVIQAAEGELLNCPIGPTTKAAAVFLRYGLNIPYRKVKELFEVFFNMPFVPASAMNFDRQATKKGQPLYEDLKDKVRALAAAHADETHWRQDGINHFLWYGGSKKLALFLIARHRSGKVAQSIFGDDFDGVLIADGYAGYNAVNAKKRQSCLAHLIRKSKEIKNEILLKKPRYQDKESIRFCNRIGELFKKACQLATKFNDEHTCQLKADAFQHRLYRALHTICSAKLADDNAENLRNRLLDPKKEYLRLFTFLKYPQVQPTNNHAEQSLRNMVIFRKVCFGTRSTDGSYSHSVLPSLLLTAKRQGKHPLDFFHTLFTCDTAIAQNALYQNSP